MSTLQFSESFGGWFRSAESGSRWAAGWGRFYACGVACQVGEPRASAAALRRTAAVPQVPATVQLDAIATLMRRTLIRTSAPIFNSLRRIVPQLAFANGV